jgi:hypothetical protein
MGNDKIHNLFLINTSIAFRILILELINETAEQNKIPSEWKEAVIIMNPKNKYRQ